MKKSIPESLETLLILLAVSADKSIKNHKISTLEGKAEIVAETIRFLEFILQKKKKASSVRKNLEKLIENLQLDKKDVLRCWDVYIADDYDNDINLEEWSQTSRIDVLADALMKIFINWCKGLEDASKKNEPDDELYDGTKVSKAKSDKKEESEDESTYDNAGAGEEIKMEDNEDDPKDDEDEDLLSQLEKKVAPVCFSRKTQIYSTDDTEEAAEWLKSIIEEHKDAKRIVGIAWKIDPKLPIKTQLPSLEEILAIKDDQEHSFGISEEYSDNKILLRLIDGSKCDEEEEPNFRLTQEMFVELEKAMKSDEPFNKDSTYVYLFDTNDKLREDFDLRSNLVQCASPYWLENLSVYSSNEEEDDKKDE